MSCARQLSTSCSSHTETVFSVNVGQEHQPLAHSAAKTACGVSLLIWLSGTSEARIETEMPPAIPIAAATRSGSTETSSRLAPSTIPIAAPA